MQVNEKQGMFKKLGTEVGLPLYPQQGSGMHEWSLVNITSLRATFVEVKAEGWACMLNGILGFCAVSWGMISMTFKHFTEVHGPTILKPPNFLSGFDNKQHSFIKCFVVWKSTQFQFDAYALKWY